MSQFTSGWHTCCKIVWRLTRLNNKVGDIRQQCNLVAVYMSPTGRAGPTRRDPAGYLKSLLKIVYVYMRRGPALLGEISLLFTRDLA
jgi:hypothetical protein